MQVNEQDHYFDENGYMVFTASYLLKRGYCCGMGCRHCPYNYEAVAEPRRTELREKKQQQQSGKNGDQEK